MTVLHDLHLAARHADHIVTLAAGRLHTAGTPHEVLTEENVEAVFALRNRVTEDPPLRAGPWLCPSADTASPRHRADEPPPGGASLSRPRSHPRRTSRGRSAQRAAGWSGTRPAFWTGGLACVVSVGLLVTVLPKLLTYDTLTDEDARRRRAARLAADHGGPAPEDDPSPAAEPPASGGAPHPLPDA